MEIQEYIETKWQEYDSGDANVKEAVIQEIKGSVINLNSFLHKLEDLEKESEAKYLPDKDETL